MFAPDIQTNLFTHARGLVDGVADVILYKSELLPACPSNVTDRQIPEDVSLIEGAKTEQG